MNETDTPRKVSHISLLTYSSWLVVGVWLLFTGGQLIYQTTNGGGSNLSYFLGALRILIGLNALRTASSVARRADQPEGFFIRVLTYVLLIMLIGLPFLLFVLQVTVTFFGTYQPGELYTENVTRLIIVAVCYLLATFFADWRLLK